MMDGIAIDRIGAAAQRIAVQLPARGDLPQGQPNHLAELYQIWGMRGPVSCNRLLGRAEP
jgi:hypothetical protein